MQFLPYLDRSRFTNMCWVPVTLEVAVALVGGVSSELRKLQEGIYWEYVLPTGAKLIWNTQDGFVISGYHHNGNDGWVAYAKAVGIIICPDHGERYCNPCIEKYVGEVPVEIEDPDLIGGHRENDDHCPVVPCICNM